MLARCMSAPLLPRHPLSPHSTSPPAPVRELSVSAARDGSHLRFSYRLTGDLAALLLAEPRTPARADGLWRHTCFEAFVGRAASTEYVEYNFSPSGEWAAYHFSGYRADMQPLESAPPRLVIHRSSDTFELMGSVDIRWLSQSPGHLGLTAVIEDRAGGLSYWALKHPADKPDFHDANGFILDL
jgi:hypothetical protein